MAEDDAGGKAASRPPLGGADRDDDGFNGGVDSDFGSGFLTRKPSEEAPVSPDKSDPESEAASVDVDDSSVALPWSPTAGDGSRKSTSGILAALDAQDLSKQEMHDEASGRSGETVDEDSPAHDAGVDGADGDDAATEKSLVDKDSVGEAASSQEFTGSRDAVYRPDSEEESMPGGAGHVGPTSPTYAAGEGTDEDAGIGSAELTEPPGQATPGDPHDFLTAIDQDLHADDADRVFAAPPTESVDPDAPEEWLGPGTVDRETVTDDFLDDYGVPFDYTSDSAGTQQSLNVEAVDRDDLVDDFLNDLDDLEEGEFDPSDTSPFVRRRGPGTVGTAPASAVDRSSASSPTLLTSGLPASAEAAGTSAPQSAEKSVSWGMISVVVVALALLAAGGYGVMTQRAGMEAEIRDLQAQLATATPLDAAEAGREQQRQIELENEALASEVRALRAENMDLGAQIAALYEGSTEQPETARAEVTPDQKGAAPTEEVVPGTPEIDPEDSAVPEPATESGSTGTWFVNFASFGERSVAESWAARLNVADGTVIVQQTSVGGRTLYRVRVIDLPSLDRAEGVASALESEYQVSRLWVGRT